MSWYTEYDLVDKTIRQVMSIVESQYENVDVLWFDNQSVEFVVNNKYNVLVSYITDSSEQFLVTFMCKVILSNLNITHSYILRNTFNLLKLINCASCLVNEPLTRISILTDSTVFDPIEFEAYLNRLGYCYLIPKRGLKYLRCSNKVDDNYREIDIKTVGLIDYKYNFIEKLLLKVIEEGAEIHDICFEVGYSV